MSQARFKVTYSPEGIEPKVWEVDIQKLKVSELIALKKASGGAITGVGPLGIGIAEMDGEALKGLLWLLLKREMSTVPWDGLDFELGQLQIDNIGEPVSDSLLRTRLELMQAADNLTAVGKRKLDELVARGVEPEPEPQEDPKA